ncbi:MAG TPA: amidase [Gaiellaceae bacterium]|jgi:Asp-tRNA(Asn)/Glu-tRNA(Gln) amidotransferase A subunit family amidase
MPATELARRIGERELSPVEVVQASLDRIESVNPTLNCFCFVYPEEALESARAAERAVAAGDSGPLHGVPIAIKDLTPTAGKRTTMGSYAFEHWVPEESALLVERLLGAGAIMVGKTTTPEFAYSSFTESPLWGVTRNPWDPARTPGGSSGGSGAAVASGCVPLAEGTDMGGSVRIPAAWCGLVGLKPSFGRIPLDFLPTQFDTIQHFGPLARTIEDARLFLSAAQGPDDRDILSLGAPLDLSRPAERSVEGMRLALDVDLGCYGVAPEVEKAVRESAGALADAGAEVEEVDLGWGREIADAWVEHWGVYLAAIFGEKLPEFRDRMDPRVVALMDAGLAMGAVDFKRIEFLRTRAWKRLAAVLADFDALLCPTMSQVARPVDEDDFVWYEDRGDGLYRGLDMTAQFNFVSQCPALSVPAGWSDEGLPIGLQIVSRRYREDDAFRIGAALEELRPWIDRHPGI